MSTGHTDGSTRWLVIAVVAGAAATIVAVGLLLGSRTDEPPSQPIAFSHRLHAGQVGLDCQYCHSGARRSSTAGVPSVASCIGCHQVVVPDRPEVQKIHAALERQRPVAWNQVYDLPEFVRFRHAPHVRSGVECATCHGDVASMTRTSRAVDPTMGFCVDCHARNEASNDCLTCHH